MSESATANGIAPPPAINPTGEEISGAPVLMARVVSSFMPLAVVGRQAQGAMLAVPDESQDFGDRGVFGRHWLHRRQSLGKYAGPMEQLLIERPHRGEPRAAELAPPHADDVEAFEARILTVDEAERDHVAADAADAADHHLRTDPRELVHRGQATDENMIADFAVPAEGRRRREDDVIADVAVVTDMTAIHEVPSIADARNAAAGDRAGIHRHLLADGAALPDLEPGQFAAPAQRLRRSAQRDERVNGAAVANRGLCRDMHMRDQPAVGADDNIRSDHAIGADESALADHRTVFDPRGGIDRIPGQAVRQNRRRYRCNFRWLPRHAGTVQ